MTLERTPLLAADGPPSLFDGVNTLENDQESPLAQLMRKKEPQDCQIDDERWESNVAAIGNVSSEQYSNEYCEIWYEISHFHFYLLVLDIFRNTILKEPKCR